MRTHLCGLVDETLVGQTVSLCGWADVTRNLGGVCFIDLRDHEGVVQVVAEPDQALFATATTVGYEDCLRVSGTVRARQSVNDRIRSGQVEVVAESIEILNRAEDLPFALHESPGEDVRLRYRYLDLRRPDMQRTMRKRIALVQGLRRWLDARGFQDVETPILTKATPEGARDFLVPARLHPGEFYALPQSPQLFKQILMVAGFDRYYQIARCFRDEALRADRQLEFTQLDMEFAWVDERMVQDTVETMLREVLLDVADIALPDPFPRLPYSEAMRRFGSDKPDLRIDLELVDIADTVRGCGFKVFADWAEAADGRVAALRLPGAASYSRKQIDDYGAYAAKFGAKGLAWIKVEDRAKGRDGVNSPVAKFLDDAVLEAVLATSAAENGDLVLFGAGPYRQVCDFMGALRLKAGYDLGRIENAWKPLWVTDFPMFEYDAEAKRWVALHHPFTAPATNDIADLSHNPGLALSRGYDMVLNGHEIGGGSIRIHRSNMQQAVFDLLGIDAEEARAKFGFLLDALNHGAPPHGGIAFGIDRIAALIAGNESIRDVIAFPKTTTAQCLMTGAPSPVSSAQWHELHLQPKPKESSAD